MGWAGGAQADQYADVNALLRQGRADEALSKADAYVAANPRDPQMRFLRGVILTDQGKQAEAISAFTALTQEFPELPEPYNNLAALYAAQSEFGKARDALETALQRNPNYATAHAELGCLACHPSVTDAHPDDGASVSKAACNDCHSEVAEEYAKTRHSAGAACADCHNPHAVRAQQLGQRARQ